MQDSSAGKFSNLFAIPKGETGLTFIVCTHLDTASSLIDASPVLFRVRVAGPPTRVSKTIGNPPLYLHFHPLDQSAYYTRCWISNLTNLLRIY